MPSASTIKSGEARRKSDDLLFKYNSYYKSDLMHPGGLQAGLADGSVPKAQLKVANLNPQSDCISLFNHSKLKNSWVPTQRNESRNTRKTMST